MKLYTRLSALFLCAVLGVCAQAATIGRPELTSPSTIEAPQSTGQSILKPLSEDEKTVNSVFDSVRQVGEAYQSGGTKALSSSLMQSHCGNLLARGGKGVDAQLAKLVDDYVPTKLQGVAGSRTQNISQQVATALCMAAQGQKTQNMDLSTELNAAVRGELLPLLLAAGRENISGLGIPFLNRLEIELGGATGGDLIGSISSVQPLWEDAGKQHHVFSQLSYYNAMNDKNNLGFRKEYDTYNAGIAYRYLTGDKTWLYGTNLFFDHAPEKNHNRMSIGVDARTSQLALSANKYWPISDWRKIDLYYEEQAAGGADIQVRGQVPELPSWTGSLKAFTWDEQENGQDLYGLTGAVEYSPVPALAMRLGITDDSQDSAQAEALLRFSYAWDKPLDEQWKMRSELAPVSQYVYEKVQRSNIIRVKQQRRDESKLTVTQTVGANTATQVSGSSSLVVGQSLLMPVTITVANTVGAIGRVALSDGSVLTLAQNSQATITPDLITLVFGSMQYVSNGAITNIVVPGGTITLFGTDIDVVAAGGDSSVRVREGAIAFAGAAGGSASLSATQAARSVAGVVGTIAENSGPYVAHSDAVSTTIDRVAAPQVGIKVAPYPYEAPRVISSNMTVGGAIIFGLRFNDPVTVSGGTPRLAFTINGNSRFASYVSGSGTNELQFSYTNVIADISALSLVVSALDRNGATITGNGKVAVTTIADTTLAVTGTGDTTPPSGQAITFTTDPLNDANKTAAAVQVTAAEVGSTYSFTIGDGISLLGPFTGTIASATQAFIGIDVSSLIDGTLTVSMTLTDTSANTSAAFTDTVLKDIVAPLIASVTTPANIVYEP